ncbi:hypothetical protein Tco_1156918 [Tanacetum coccineum]
MIMSSSAMVEILLDDYVAIEGLESNKLWLEQWFEDLKLWDENCESSVRLAWINLEGLPIIARNMKAVTTIAKEFGIVLEVINVKLNGKVHSVKVFEDRKNSLYFISSHLPDFTSKDIKSKCFPNDDGVLDSDDDIFEEEFVGPTLDEWRLFSGDSLGLHNVWSSWIPCKVNICVWKASIDRLLTRPNLAARGHMEKDMELVEPCNSCLFSFFRCARH